MYKKEKKKPQQYLFCPNKPNKTDNSHMWLLLVMYT